MNEIWKEIWFVDRELIDVSLLSKKIDQIVCKGGSDYNFTASG